MVAIDTKINKHLKHISKSQQDQRSPWLVRSVMSGLLSLPITISMAHADTAPERGLIAFKYLDYQDKQPGLERISVTAPSMSVMLPINEEWSVDASHTVDSVSGASPRYHSEKLSAARMQDTRKGSDLKLTKYFPQGTLGIAAALSRESDYISKVISVNGSISTENKNTTLNFGIATTHDQINPTNQIVVNEKKNVLDLLFGITEVMTTHDIVQMNITHSEGRGYYSDPYKFFDNRPRRKTNNSILVRWNHHFEASGGSSRLGYRYYKDSFGIKSHTMTAEYLQPLHDGWTVAPLIRIYSQTAASFYYDPVTPPDPTIPDNFEPGKTLLSEDQRLAAFGGHSIGLKLSKWLNRNFLVDLKYEHYKQKSDWCFNSDGSPGISPFTANIAQIGLSYFF